MSNLSDILKIKYPNRKYGKKQSTKLMKALKDRDWEAVENWLNHPEIDLLTPNLENNNFIDLFFEKLSFEFYICEKWKNENEYEGLIKSAENTLQKLKKIADIVLIHPTMTQNLNILDKINYRKEVADILFKKGITTEQWHHSFKNALYFNKSKWADFLWENKEKCISFQLSPKQEKEIFDIVVFCLDDEKIFKRSLDMSKEEAEKWFEKLIDFCNNMEALVFSCKKRDKKLLKLILNKKNTHLDFSTPSLFSLWAGNGILRKDVPVLKYLLNPLLKKIEKESLQKDEIVQKWVFENLNGLCKSLAFSNQKIKSFEKLKINQNLHDELFQKIFSVVKHLDNNSNSLKGMPSLILPLHSFLFGVSLRRNNDEDEIYLNEIILGGLNVLEHCKPIMEFYKGNLNNNGFSGAIMQSISDYSSIKIQQGVLDWYKKNKINLNNLEIEHGLWRHGELVDLNGDNYEKRNLKNTVLMNIAGRNKIVNHLAFEQMIDYGVDIYTVNEKNESVLSLLLEKEKPGSDIALKKLLESDVEGKFDINKILLNIIQKNQKEYLKVLMELGSFGLKDENPNEKYDFFCKTIQNTSNSEEMLSLLEEQRLKMILEVKDNSKKTVKRI